MKRMLVSAFALGMMTTGAMAGEQLKTSQLDQVTAGVQVAVALARQANFNATFQSANAGSAAFGGCVICSKGSGNTGSSAIAANQNATQQTNSNAAVNVR